MANVWVGTDYYIPSIDLSGDTVKVQINSTTTSNTYVYETIKNTTSANSESVGAAAIVWLNGFGFASDYYFSSSSDDTRRTTIAPSSTTSENGTGLQIEYAVAANGFLEIFPFPNHFDTKVANANTVAYHVTSGGTGWLEQDQISFTNISGGHPNHIFNTEKLNNFTGEIVWTDKNGPCFMDGTPEVNLASNATFHVNAMIRAGTWAP